MATNPTVARAGKQLLRASDSSEWKKTKNRDLPKQEKSSGGGPPTTLRKVGTNQQVVSILHKLPHHQS